MTTTLLPQKPDAAAPVADRPDHQVAVRVSIPLAIPGYFPHGNFIAASLLGCICADALDQESLRAKNVPNFPGYFNDSWFVYLVTDTARSLETLDAALKRVNLRNFSSLLFFHERLRLYQPYGFDGASIGRGFSLEQMMENLQRVNADREALLAQIQAYNDAQKRNPGDTSAPPADPAP